MDRFEKAFNTAMETAQANSANSTATTTTLAHQSALEAEYANEIAIQIGELMSSPVSIEVMEEAISRKKKELADQRMLEKEADLKKNLWKTNFVDDVTRPVSLYLKGMLNAGLPTHKQICVEGLYNAFTDEDCGAAVATRLSMDLTRALAMTNGEDPKPIVDILIDVMDIANTIKKVEGHSKGYGKIGTINTCITTWIKSVAPEYLPVSTGTCIAKK